MHQGDGKQVKLSTLCASDINSPLHKAWHAIPVSITSTESIYVKRSVQDWSPPSIITTNTIDIGSPMPTPPLFPSTKLVRTLEVDRYTGATAIANNTTAMPGVSAS
eukprot:6202791-Pleurochrysis_carterae.AAC.2